MMKKLLYGVALALVASVSVGSLQSCKDDVNDLATQTSYNLSKLNSDLTNKLQTLDQNTAAALAKKADITYVDGLVGDLQVADQQLASKIQGALDRIGGIEALIPEGEIANKAYVDGKAEALQAEIDALKEYVNEGDEALEALIRDTQEALTMALNAHAADIEDLQGQIDTLQEAIDAIIAKLDKQVTGILIQGVYSPVFGDFRTPLGVKSNILFNWFGFNERNKAVDFPSADVLPAALAPAKYTAPIGYYGDDAEGNVTLGKVYVTLNPVGAQFDNLEVSLEKSNGEALPYTVALTPSDYVLQNGYTRTAENGFYEGEVKMPLNEDDVNEIALTIEEDLKVAMKDALKDPSRTTAKALVKAVFEQLQGKIPAYGLRYGWYNGLADETDPGFAVGTYAAVLSQYDLAVATAHPLSYNFLKDVHGSTQLPEIGHIQNFINKLKEIGTFSFTFEPFTVDKITIDLGQIDFNAVNTDLSISLNDVTLKYEDGTEVKASTEEPIIIDGSKSGMKAMLDDIKEAINTTLTNADSSVNTQLASMTSNIEKQVNDMMDKINDQVNGKINDVITSIENKLEPYYGKINTAIDIYNKIAGKINNFIANPNAYMQVAAFYSMGGTNYGIVSGKADDPTLFVGDGEAFKLYLSSYTAELIVPACKKYVAITAAPAGVDLVAINSGNLNKVLDGNQIVVEVAKPTVKGVYEFTYQALDYSGYTSTKKFYIEVK